MHAFENGRTKVNLFCHGKSGKASEFGLAVAAIVVCFGALSFAQDFVRLSVPVPIFIDSQLTGSKLYLKLEMKNINRPFDEFAAGRLDKSETMFVTAMRAARKNDAAGFAEVWTAPDQMPSPGRNASGHLKEDDPGAWLKLYRSMFDFDKITVVAEALVGRDTMFIWESQTKDGARRASNYVGLDKTGHPRLSALSGGNPVQALLQESFEAAPADRDAYKPAANLNLRYQYAIPLAGPNESGPHPVFLEFDGTPMDFPLGNKKAIAPTPLLEFYRHAALAQQNGDTEEYAASFTPKSQERVRQWQAAEEERLKQMKPKTPPVKPIAPPAAVPQTSPQASGPPTKSASLPKGTNVKFVLQADPVFLVFQAPGPGNDWLPDQLAYFYVVREGNSFKLANFGYAATLDDLLQDSSLFNKQILKPAPAKPGAPKAKVQPSPAKPAGAKP